MAEYRRTTSAISPKAGRRVASHKKALQEAKVRSRKRTVEITVSDATKILGSEALISILEYTKTPRRVPAVGQVERIAISGVEARLPVAKVERATTPAKPSKARNLSKDASALLLRLEHELTDPQVDLRGVDPDRIIQAVMRLVPHRGRNELAERVGPFYDTGGLMSWLGISRQAINKKVHAGKLVACKTEDRVLLYPTWQFGEDGELRPGLSEVLDILWTGTQDGWTIALWLVTAAEQFDGKSAVEWLSESKDFDVVQQVARRDAAVWAA